MDCSPSFHSSIGIAVRALGLRGRNGFVQADTTTDYLSAGRPAPDLNSPMAKLTAAVAAPTIITVTASAAPQAAAAAHNVIFSFKAPKAPTFVPP